MPRISKRTLQCRAASANASAKRQRLQAPPGETEQSEPLPNLVAPSQEEDEHEATDSEISYFSDWNSSDDSGSDNDESEDDGDLENLEVDMTLFTNEVETVRGSIVTRNILEHLFNAAQHEAAFSHKFPYQRGPQPGLRWKQKKAKQAKELQAAAKGCISLDNLLVKHPTTEPTRPHDIKRQQQDEARHDLDKMLKQKSTQLVGHNLLRHRVVLAYLYIQRDRTKGETRKSLAALVARAYGKGSHFARKLITWERTWVAERNIDEGAHGCFAKTRSWLEDEGVVLAAREWIAQTGEHVTAHGLAKAIGKYLDSRAATETLTELFGPGGNRIRARTARRWLRKMGLRYDKVRKDIYLDGHEREDVVKYRQEVFIPRWQEYQKRMAIFDEIGNWIPPPGLKPEEKVLILLTHDESTFHSNDSRGQVWSEKGKQPLRPKGRGKGIMVSAFLTPGGLLSLPDSITDDQLLRDYNDWPIDPNTQKPVRDSFRPFIYGKESGYWNGDLMVEHAIEVATRIFPLVFPGCQALFAFDNASNHSSFSPDALIASKMNLGSGGSQPLMRNGFIGSIDNPQAMVFPDAPEYKYRGQAKGIRQVLKERGLWREYRIDGFRFLLQCPKTQGRPGCRDIEGGCCARSVLAAQPDFQQQKGRLEEELRALHHEVIFYPKFHCETNFIERYWCSCKAYLRDNCMYSFKSLQEQLPTTLKSINTATINRYYNHCIRIIKAYEAGYVYGTEKFTETICKGHRQVLDPTKY